MIYLVFRTHPELSLTAYLALIARLIALRKKSGIGFSKIIKAVLQDGWYPSPLFTTREPEMLRLMNSLTDCPD